MYSTLWSSFLRQHGQSYIRFCADHAAYILFGEHTNYPDVLISRKTSNSDGAIHMSYTPAETLHPSGDWT